MLLKCHVLKLCHVMEIMCQVMETMCHVAGFLCGAAIIGIAFLSSLLGQTVLQVCTALITSAHPALPLFLRVYALGLPLSVCLLVRPHVCACVCGGCVCACARLCVRACVCMCMCVCVCQSVHACMYVCMNVIIILEKQHGLSNSCEH